MAYVNNKASSAWDAALSKTHRQKSSVARGLFSRFAHVTRPPKHMQHGANRLMFDVGRYGIPLGAGYLAGQHFGLWGQPQPAGQPGQYPGGGQQRVARANVPEQSFMGTMGGYAPEQFKHAHVDPNRLVRSKN